LREEKVRWPWRGFSDLCLLFFLCIQWRRPKAQEEEEEEEEEEREF
jgi:hypothetical protein